MSHYRRANRLGTQGWRNKELESKGVSVTIPKSPWEEDNGEKTMGAMKRMMLEEMERDAERDEGENERVAREDEVGFKEPRTKVKQGK
tara:strand:- start:3 stop:266 length:264 start_codon:yes stop_codon:yes gene_type:complete